MRKKLHVLSLQVALGAHMMHKSLRFLPLETMIASRSNIEYDETISSTSTKAWVHDWWYDRHMASISVCLLPISRLIHSISVTDRLRSVLFQFLAAIQIVIMAALRSRCGHYIFSLWFLFLFFLAYTQWSEIGCVPYFHTWCGLSANLECRSETCCMRLAENTGCKKVAKNRHVGTIAQICRAVSSQLRHVSTIGKKTIKQQYLLHMSS